MKKIRDYFYRLPAYLLWALFAALLVLAVFQGATDTERAKKITLMINVPEVDEKGAMRYLKELMPDAGLEMIKVRSFSYALFLEASLKEADIWIVKESDIGQFLPDFGPVAGFREGHPAYHYWQDENPDIWGLRVYEAAEDRGILQAYVNYGASGEKEDYYMFFNPASLHIGAGDNDEAAFHLVEKLMDSEMKSPFIKGMDASIVPALEAGGVKYFNFKGEEQDVFEILAEAGLNAIRVRVWNHPFDEAGRGFGGGNCNMDTALSIGRRAAAAGLSLLVGFHYSDFWADPGKQMAPRAWGKMDLPEKADALYQYTRDSLLLLKAAGIPVSMVQIGNETNGAMAGEKNWENMAQLMKAGSRAVREVLPDARIALHFTNPEKTGSYRYYGEQLARYEVDYDVFGTSYYPVWHGSMENLTAALNEVAGRWSKQTAILETAYPYTLRDSDFYGNLIQEGTKGIARPYPFTLDGQQSFLRDMLDLCQNKLQNCVGLFYWEGCWISAGGSSRGENQALWEQYGSGWASSYAGIYDPQDAGRYYGGCAVDNQALFDEKGYPLEALKLFGP